MTVAAPYALLAEVTHQCPLHCAYCSNPLQLQPRDTELATQDWLRVLGEAAALGVVQVHFSGGEPLARRDLVDLVARARGLGIFSNLITSGLGLTPARAGALADAGLNSVQLSVQAADDLGTETIAGRAALDAKQRAAQHILAAKLPLSMNVVLHRQNLDQLDEIIGLCERWGADRLELANTQYYGWALQNRAVLLPTEEQLGGARVVYERRRAELRGRMELLWIIPDYFERFPKPCMGGWAATALTVDPAGVVYPCPTASAITTLSFPSVRDHGLEWIWQESPAFNAFRGEAWMPEPCRSCERRFEDFGGCRCQAFALTGDASRTDPVCNLSPDRHLVDEALRDAQATSVPAPSAIVYRRNPLSTSAH